MDSQNIRSNDALKCPRCYSFDTKFCYYNNYNYSQPRHFCKTCRRYWTIGGVLRNVPIGGGTRKSKNPKQKPAAIVRDSPSSNSNSKSGILGSSHFLAGKAASGARRAVDSSVVVTNLSSVEESRSSAPLVLGCIDGTPPLKVNQAGGCYGWIESGRDSDRTVEKRARGEGFGSLDLSRSEGMVEICSGVNGGSWLKFCGLTAPFDN